MHACMHLLAPDSSRIRRARSRVRAAGAGDVRICPRFADRKAMPLQTTIIKNKAELFKELENAPWGKVSGIYRDKTDPTLKVTSLPHAYMRAAV